MQDTLPTPWNICRHIAAESRTPRRRQAGPLRVQGCLTRKRKRKIRRTGATGSEFRFEATWRMEIVAYTSWRLGPLSLRVSSLRGSLCKDHLLSQSPQPPKKCPDTLVYKLLLSRRPQLVLFSLSLLCKRMQARKDLVADQVFSLSGDRGTNYRMRGTSVTSRLLCRQSNNLTTFIVRVVERVCVSLSTLRYASLCRPLAGVP